MAELIYKLGKPMLSTKLYPKWENGSKANTIASNSKQDDVSAKFG